MVEDGLGGQMADHVLNADNVKQMIADLRPIVEERMRSTFHANDNHIMVNSTTCKNNGFIENVLFNTAYTFRKRLTTDHTMKLIKADETKTYLYKEQLVACIAPRSVSNDCPVQVLLNLTGGSTQNISRYFIQGPKQQ